MHPENPIVRLCIEGMKAEGERRLDRARDLFEQAWTSATTNFEKCVAAHYVARHQPTPEDTLHWNKESLRLAEAVGNDSVEAFFPSLYLNLGHSYEIMGDHDLARHYFDLADARSRILEVDRYGDVVLDAIRRGRERVG
jgi:hypothetical protein